MIGGNKWDQNCVWCGENLQDYNLTQGSLTGFLPKLRWFYRFLRSRTLTLKCRLFLNMGLNSCMNQAVKVWWRFGEGLAEVWVVQQVDGCEVKRLSFSLSAFFFSYMGLMKEGLGVRPPADSSGSVQTNKQTGQQIWAAKISRSTELFW